jgi:hypothetical protein
MKILFICHMREGTGYSEASFGYMNALIAGGHDVVARNYKLNGSWPEIPDNIAELERKPLEGCEIVIQHLLPHNMSYIPNMKNIGICVHDTSSLRYCEWDRYLNCMDEVWIPNTWTPYMEEITVPVKYIPHAFDVSKYTKEHENLDIKELGGTCVFYTIAELNIRKNFRDTLIAFHTEFHSNEPVSFIIKTSGGGLSPEETHNVVSQSINQIKDDLKLYPSPEKYKPEVIITHRLTNEQIESLHCSGDCYVNTSHGEGWCIPQFDAWAYGNKVVYYSSPVNDYVYMRKNPKHQVDCKAVNILGYKDTFPNLGTAREEWSDSNIPALRKAMRSVYDEWLNNPAKVTHTDYQEYSYEEVGKKINESI